MALGSNWLDPIKVRSSNVQVVVLEGLLIQATLHRSSFGRHNWSKCSIQISINTPLLLTSSGHKYLFIDSGKLQDDFPSTSWVVAPVNPVSSAPPPPIFQSIACLASFPSTTFSPALHWRHNNSCCLVIKQSVSRLLCFSIRRQTQSRQIPLVNRITIGHAPQSFLITRGLGII